MINCLHHFEILTKHSERVLNYFIKGFDFRLIGIRNTPSALRRVGREERADGHSSSTPSVVVYQQHLLNCNAINLLVTSLKPAESNAQEIVGQGGEDEKSLFRTSLSAIESASPKLLDKIVGKHDSAFNVAFQVCNLDRILENCYKHDVAIIKPRHKLFDPRRVDRDGQVDCAIIKSCVDGVVHTLIDSRGYQGRFLPGFEEAFASRSGELDRALRETKAFSPTHYDHLTYATHKNTSQELIDWYAKIFNMKRFRVEKEGKDGLIVKTGSSGMNLKVINYWLCAETGVHFEPKSTDESNDFKFVISEPLDDDSPTNVSEQKKKANQISIFLEENGGPGVQHIGLYSKDVVQLVKSSKKNNSTIKYFETPETYYNTPEKVDEIEKCGLNRDDLKKNHVLLDAEFDSNQTTDAITGEKSESETSFYRKYLLQVFTQPLFERNTLFLELIQRVGNANGFGAANIRALWNAVQLQMSSQEQPQAPEPVQNVLKSKSR